ncbi:MAG: hypothetical protein H7Z16_00935 [Pyrinomonadaceae bacterium]|nr:hypothetical protein [Pyrinomonadaceae bacterium]
MTKNTKIALGCGGAGCLGLILIVIIAAVLIVTGVIKAPGIYSPRSNYNYNYNYNSNRNSNYNSNTNLNSNRGSSSSTLSNDEKHKLFQAAYATKDNQLVLRMLTKIGFPNGTGDGFAKFTEEHIPWAMRNLEFMGTVNTAEKARAYFDAHIDD